MTVDNDNSHSVKESAAGKKAPSDEGATRDPCAGGTWIAKAGSDLQSRPGPEAVERMRD